MLKFEVHHGQNKLSILWGSGWGGCSPWLEAGTLQGVGHVLWAEDKKSASCSNTCPIFLFPLLLPLSNKSWGLAMGNSSWMAPLLSSLLLNMKSEDVAQGPALKINHPVTFGWWCNITEAFFMSYNERSLSSGWANVLLITVENSPKVSCRSPSWYPWWVLFGWTLPTHISMILNVSPEPLCKSQKLSPVIKMSYVCPPTWVVSFTLYNFYWMWTAWLAGGRGEENFSKML